MSNVSGSENRKIPADKDHVATITTMRAFARADMSVHRRTRMMTEAEMNKALSPSGSIAGFMVSQWLVSSVMRMGVAVSERADDDFG